MNRGGDMGYVRRAAMEDKERIYQLISALEGADVAPEDFFDVFVANLSNPSIFYFVYEENYTVGGFVSVHIQKLLHHTGNIAEIQEIIVDKDMRGTGIGKLLFEKAKEVGWGNKCIQLEVCCNQKRLSSHGFYRSRGMSCNHFKFCLGLSGSDGIE